MSSSIDGEQMVTRRELNEGKRKTKGRGRIGVEGREICDVLQDERVCPSVDFFSRIGQPYRTTHAFSQYKACLDDPTISIQPCRDRLS